MAKRSQRGVTEFFEALSRRKCGNSLRPHQIEGIEFMVNCRNQGHGCILADEMGLGKTCQALTMISYLMHKTTRNDKVSSLIVCPLSIVDQWRNEPKKFGYDLNIVVYRGDKNEREQLRDEIGNNKNSWDAILTTYEFLINDSDFFAGIHWTAIIVDEAHRLKNVDSLLRSIIGEQLEFSWILLLTGTPVQNNMRELYSLLSLCDREEFPLKMLDRFVKRFTDVKNEKTVNKLREIMKRYVLRRTKDSVSVDMPTKSEVVVFHNLTNLQKELYKAILVKNYNLFEQGSLDGNKQRLANTLVQLRKCVGHPYLFKGIEPEPFEEGEHLVKASGKLLILDVLLSFLKKHGHKVLLYSQMTAMLDIVQDYLTYRDYSYERLDGSVRGEERFAAVHRFSNMETFCFLLSTKAGGLGLNLVAADTVIFLDSDFNPQNDLQAAARAHRMGQTRHVKIIRLIGRRTVEEIILARAAAKLEFTDIVLEEQREDFTKVLSTEEMGEMLMFGLSEMGKDEKKSVELGDQDLEKLLGESQGERWVAPENVQEKKDWIDEVEMKDMYTFEGKDYREEARQADREAWDALKLVPNQYVDRLVGGSNNKKQDSSNVEKRKSQMTDEELEEMKEKRRMAAEENRLKKEEEKKARLVKLWKENDYESSNLPEPSNVENDAAKSVPVDVGDLDDSALSEENSSSNLEPIFVVGDVTKPDLKLEHGDTNVIILHVVDDSGSWGTGGLFTALESLSNDIETRYELAKQMKDLNPGDAHLIEVNREKQEKNARKMYVALVVAQNYKKRSEIKMDSLEKGLKRVSDYAAKNSCSVHMPRIGYGMASFNWYRTERMIKKLFCQCAVPVYIYYFPRNQRRKRRQTEDEPDKEKREEQADEGGTDGSNSSEQGRVTKPKRMRKEEAGDLPYLPSIFSGNMFWIHGSIPEGDARHLQRFIIAFGGQVAEVESDAHVTHVVVENEVTKDAMVSEGSARTVVTHEWLMNCIKSKKIVEDD